MVYICTHIRARTHTHTHTHTLVCIYIYIYIYIYVHKKHIYIYVYILGVIGKFSPFKIIISILVLYIFCQVLSKVQLTRISCALSVRKAAPCCNSLIKKFQKRMMKYLSFTLEVPVRRIQSFFMPIKRPSHIHIDGNKNPSP